MDAFATKESKYSEAGCLINLFHFRNTSPSRISSLVRYWVGNNILAGVDLIHSGINLQWIPKTSHLQSMWKIATYEREKIYNRST